MEEHTCDLKLPHSNRKCGCKGRIAYPFMFLASRSALLLTRRAMMLGDALQFAAACNGVSPIVSPAPACAPDLSCTHTAWPRPWSAHGPHMASTWPAHGQHMASTWSAQIMPNQRIISTTGALLRRFWPPCSCFFSCACVSMSVSVRNRPDSRSRKIGCSRKIDLGVGSVHAVAWC